MIWRFFLLLFAAIIVRPEAGVPEFLPVSSYPVTASFYYPVSESFSAVTYGNGRFVAVGASNIVYSLDDGYSWVQGVGFPPIQYRAIAFGDGRFVAVGDDWFQSAESYDGIKWHSIPLGSGNAVAIGNGRVVVDPASVVFFNGQFISMTGPDAILNNIPTTVGAITIDRLVNFVSASIYIGVQAHGTYPYLDGRAHAWIIFLSQSGPNGPWVQSGTAGAQIAMFSTGRRIFAFNRSITGIPFSLPYDRYSYVTAGAESRFVMVGLQPFQVSYYDDRDVGGWESSSYFPNARLVSAARGSNIVVSVGSLVPNPALFVTTNGFPTLAQLTPPQGSGLLNAVRFADGRFIAVGNSGTVIRSFDGITWSKRSTNINSDLFDAAWGTNGMWVAVGSSGRIVTSPDAAQFTVRSSGAAMPLYGITYGMGQFVGVGGDGVIITSQNGIDWAATTTDEKATIYSVAYGNNRFVAVGTNGFVHVSTNAANWTGQQVPNAGGFMRVAFANGSFVALATNNMVFASRDGSTWDSTKLGSFALAGVDASDGELWLTGEKSSIWRTSESPLLGPSIRPTLDSKGTLRFTLEVKLTGDYGIEVANDLGAGIWTPLSTLTNVQTSATWAETNEMSGLRFYRAVKQ